MKSADLPALLYHHIGPLREGTYPSLTITPEKFDLQMRWLELRGYVGVRISDYFSRHQSQKKLPKKPILLTFDDAYADLTKYALPTLKRLGFGGVVFVVTGQIGGTNTWDTARGSGVHDLMSASQIIEWAEAGIEFGAHSRTHVDLTTLDESRLCSEVQGSAADLSNLLGGTVQSFAYPYGAFNDSVQKCVRNSFDLAFTIEEGLNSSETDYHRLRRSMVTSNDTLLDFDCRVRLGCSPIQRFRSRLRLRSRARGLITWLGDGKV
jgi:peptidoglycan/xylan/chitin deacetylase (PgdA/CDA1 family)